MYAIEYKNEKAMDISSDEEPYDSDLIDSDVEAELYSVIHHETDNSTLNCEDSYLSLNSSNKENASRILDYKEFNMISNVSYNESNQNNDEIDSSDVQIIEIIDKVSDDKINRNTAKDNFINSLKSFTFKRKSDSDFTVFDDSPTNKKQKNNETVALNSSVENDSSEEDDDNDIICLGPINNQKQFETNVSEIIVADSDSNSADSWCFKSPKFNTSTPSTAKTKEQWFVNSDDLYRSRRSSSRYHESQFMTCTRCNQNGHSFKFCSFTKEMKCFICGSNHSSFRCKSKICAKCFGTGHDMRQCTKGIEICALCQMAGHRQEICPDLWRRFQRTTPKKSKKIWRLLQDTPFFCYNCGLPGHFGALCKNRRMNTHSFPTWPFVLNYKVQNQIQVGLAKKVSNKAGVNGIQQQFPKEKNKKKKVKKPLPVLNSTQQVSFPRSPKNSQMKLQNVNNCVGQDSKEKLLKKEAKKEKRLRRKQRRKSQKQLKQTQQ